MAKKSKKAYPQNPNKRDKSLPSPPDPVVQKGLNINKGTDSEPSHVKVECVVDNCGTSVGDCILGDIAEVPETEAEFLIERGQFKEVKNGKTTD